MAGGKSGNIGIIGDSDGNIGNIGNIDGIIGNREGLDYGSSLENDASSVHSVNSFNSDQVNSFVNQTLLQDNNNTNNTQALIPSPHIAAVTATGGGGVGDVNGSNNSVSSSISFLPKPSSLQQQQLLLQLLLPADMRSSLSNSSSSIISHSSSNNNNNNNNNTIFMNFIQKAPLEMIPPGNSAITSSSKNRILALKSNLIASDNYNNSNNSDNVSLLTSSHSLDSLLQPHNPLLTKSVESILSKKKKRLPGVVTTATTSRLTRAGQRLPALPTTTTTSAISASFSSTAPLAGGGGGAGQQLLSSFIQKRPLSSDIVSSSSAAAAAAAAIGHANERGGESSFAMGLEQLGKDEVIVQQLEGLLNNTQASLSAAISSLYQWLFFNPKEALTPISQHHIGRQDEQLEEQAQEAQRSLTNLMNHLAGLIQQALSIQRTHYVNLLKLSECELQHLHMTTQSLTSQQRMYLTMLVEARQQLPSSSSLLDILPTGTATGATASYGTDNLMGLREKVWLLENKLERLNLDKFSETTKTIERMVEDITNLSQREKQLLFSALIAKQQAVDIEKQQHQQHQHQGGGGLEEKEHRALRHRIITLRNLANAQQQRAQEVRLLRESRIKDLHEHIESYERTVCNALPEKMLRHLFAFASPAKALQLQPQLQLQLQSKPNGDSNNNNNNVMMTAAGNSLVGGNGLEEGSINSLGSKREVYLAAAEKSLMQQLRPSGTIGSLPAAPSQSIFAANTTLYGRPNQVNGGSGGGGSNGSVSSSTTSSLTARRRR
eukprot:scaffold96_cov167-Ochromonas_danica.AAC.36